MMDAPGIFPFPSHLNSPFGNIGSTLMSAHLEVGRRLPGACRAISYGLWQGQEHKLGWANRLYLLNRGNRPLSS